MSSAPFRSEVIRCLNDAFRKSFGGGQVMVTRGIGALPGEIQLNIFQKVQLFNDFDRANDPHGEHDFGSIEHEGHKVFFKIDYYDKSMEMGSENPADPDQTTRVMTIMFSHEY
jgi:Protein of unknown function (DUF3768)